MPMPKRYTTATFVATIRAIHGDKYDYSEVIYNRLNEQVKVICKEHGPFWTFASAILNVQSGCPICRPSAKGRTKEQFISEMTIKYGGKFNYSKVPDRVASMAILDIECPIHGWFTQLARTHMHDTEYGCKKCGAVATSEKLTRLKRIRKGEPVELEPVVLSNVSVHLNSLRRPK